MTSFNTHGMIITKRKVRSQKTSKNLETYPKPKFVASQDFLKREGAGSKQGIYINLEIRVKK